MRNWKQYWMLPVALVFVLAAAVLACEPPAPAEFEVVSLDVTPQEIAPGEQVTITVDVENSGGRKDAYTATLRIAGVEEHTKVVEVAPQETETVLFTVVKDEPGKWSVRVDGLSETLRVLRPAEFTVDSLDISPSVGRVGETVSVTAAVTNAGEVEGKHSVSLTIDGSQVDTKGLTVAAGATVTVSFAFTSDASGRYTVEVGELSGFLIVTETGDALAELATAYRGLYHELLKLPDLEEIDDRDREAIEDIAYLALKPEYKEAFESMLDEGIKEKRKYCTPLEALLWIAYDRELTGYTPLRGYSLDELLWEAWENSSTSKNYASERWQDFDKVVDRLNSPYVVNTWVMDNLVYDPSRLKNVGNPQTTFELKRGVCRHFGMFATECLSKAGYNAKNLSVLWGQDEGHGVCIVNANSALWIVADSTRLGQTIGPFPTYDDAAKNIVKQSGQEEKDITYVLVEDNGQLMRRNSRAYGVYDP